MINFFKQLRLTSTFVIGGLLFVPVISGLFLSLLGSFGIVPALVDADHFTISPWISWFLENTSIHNTLITIFIAVTATALSLFLAFSYLELFSNIIANKWHMMVIFIILSTPHIALASSLSSTYSGSGIFGRFWCLLFDCQMASLFIMEECPVIMIILTLVIKETAFFLFIIGAELSRIDLTKIINTGKSLGYSNYRIFQLLILPQVYPTIKLPLLMVLSYSLSGVEIPLVFSDVANKPESIIVFRLFRNPLDLNDYMPGFAGSIWLVVLFFICYLIWRLLERLAMMNLKLGILLGRRKDPLFSNVIRIVAILAIVLVWFIPVVTQLIWSVADSWRFPALLPQSFSLQNYKQAFVDIYVACGNTILLGLVSSILGIIAALIVTEEVKDKPSYWFSLFKYLAVIPLILPQISFLFGFQTLLSQLMISGTWLAMIWVHFIFCFCYSFLILKDYQLKIDPRFMQAAYSLGLSRINAWFRVKLFLLFPAIKIALGVCFSVSLALYLPTLFASAGRHKTLITESMALLSSYSPKVSAIYTLMLMVIPFSFLTICGWWKDVSKRS